MERWAGKVAVVTGASAGIGLAIAQALVKEGMLVVGLARRKDLMAKRMSSTKGPGKFYPRKCDISNAEEVVETFRWVKDTFGTLHVLINNAAVVMEGPVGEAKTEELQQMININLMGTIYCTKEAIKLMKANGEEGNIISISSVAGIVAPSVDGKHYGVYAASKSAMRSLNDSLNHELLDTKIRTTSICPGLVKTEIFERGNLDMSHVDESKGLEPEDVAYFVVEVIKAPARVRVSEVTIRPTGEPIY